MDRNNALFLHINHCCLIGNFEKFSFNQANKELNEKFEIIDKFFTHENVKSHFEYI